MLRAMPVSAAATDYLEGDGVTGDDIAITVRVTIADGIFHADFAGTSAAVPGNVNCPIAVTRSAVLFVVRTLLPDDVPMNGGVSRAIRVSAPRGALVNAEPPSAVAAGNVETSQRIADVVFRALAAGGRDVPALGQGTMNNLTFGGSRSPESGAWTYYETIGGGQGASRGANGPSGVHVGMSNTLNTPIEVLELEHPLRVRTYALRRGSGGRGTWDGGDGVVREFEALAPAEATLLTERRRHGPAGGSGGAAGAPGTNQLNGVALPSKVTLRLSAGDILRIETPGGGGWGRE
jgi:N-methylhydantoinase B